MHEWRKALMYLMLIYHLIRGLYAQPDVASMKGFL